MLNDITLFDAPVSNSAFIERFLLLFANTSNTVPVHEPISSRLQISRCSGIVLR